MSFKVAQVTTTLQGGAGIAAVRLNDALISQSVDSQIVSSENGSNPSKTLFSKALTVFQSKVLQSNEGLVTTLSLNRLEKSVLSEFDILHFHSIYNLMSTEKILELSETKTIFVTLHDQRMITGGCHYSGKCKGYLNDCQSCPQARRLFWSLVQNEKSRITQLLTKRNVHYISPSTWLAENALELVKGIAQDRVQVVRNPIPEFKQKSNNPTRAQFDIKNDEFVVGFVSVHLNNPLKGLKDLVSALEYLPANLKDRTRLLLIGSGKVDWIPREIRKTIVSKWVPSSITIYSLMNVLVVPSLQENSPNVIGEALMSGTPTIGSSVGGIPELLNGFGLPTFEAGNHREIADAIISVSKLAIDKALISNAVLQFGYSAIGQRIKNLYERALERAL
jgi:glycosyltransferase involved in cell wall biosynthesis